MFCPKCRDEFRSGFTHCAGCNVDLVEDLSAVDDRSSAEPADAAASSTPAPGFPIRLVDFCGFFSLQDARHARDQLRLKRIRSEVVLREAPDASWDEPVKEEAWIRVEAGRLKEVNAILDESSPPEPAAGESFGCSECGQKVAAEESFCPKCGARFEEG